MKRRSSLCHADRRGPGRVAAADRLDGGKAAVSLSAAGRCSPSCFSGRFRTSWRSPGSIATTTRARGFPMLPVVEPDGRRTGRQAVLYAAALVPVSVAPTVVGLTGAAYFWTALVLGVAFAVDCRAVRAVANRRDRPRRCSTARSPTCRSSGRRCYWIITISFQPSAIS